MKSIAVDFGRSTNACLQLLRGGVQSAFNLVSGSIQNAASRKGAAIILILDRRQLLISRGVRSKVKFLLEYYWNREELKSAVAILQDCQRQFLRDRGVRSVTRFHREQEWYNGQRVMTRVSLSTARIRVDLIEPLIIKTSSFISDITKKMKTIESRLKS